MQDSSNAIKDCPASYLAPIEELPDGEPDTRIPTVCDKITDESHGPTHADADGTEWTDDQPGACADWHDRYVLAQPETPETAGDDAAVALSA